MNLYGTHINTKTFGYQKKSQSHTNETFFFSKGTNISYFYCLAYYFHYLPEELRNHSILTYSSPTKPKVSMIFILTFSAEKGYFRWLVFALGLHVINNKLNANVHKFNIFFCFASKVALWDSCIGYTFRAL